MKGLKSYNHGTKAKWRRWTWNRIIDAEMNERRNVSVKAERRRVASNMRVLYLIGPENADVDVAMSLGFRRENLIGVDFDAENVKRARQKGSIAIHGALEDVIYSWPKNDHIDAIHADLCCGLTKQAKMVMEACLVSQGCSESTVLCLNLQRGRDSWSNVCRNELIDLAEYLSLPKTHRGGHALGCMMQVARSLMESLTVPERDIRRLFCAWEKRSPLAFTTYSWSKVHMDTLVTRLPKFDWYLEHPVTGKDAANYLNVNSQVAFNDMRTVVRAAIAVSTTRRGERRETVNQRVARFRRWLIVADAYAASYGRTTTPVSWVANNA